MPMHTPPLMALFAHPSHPSLLHRLTSLQSPLAAVGSAPDDGIFPSASPCGCDEIRNPLGLID